MGAASCPYLVSKRAQRPHHQHYPPSTSAAPSAVAKAPSNQPCNQHNHRRYKDITFLQTPHRTAARCSHQLHNHHQHQQQQLQLEHGNQLLAGFMCDICVLGNAKWPMWPTSESGAATPGSSALQPDSNANSLSFGDVVDDALRFAVAAAFTYAFHVRAATFSGNQMIGNLHTFEHINRHTSAYTRILMLLE